MNIVILDGRLTRDPETKAAGQTTITRTGIAVERSYKQDGQPTADFINIMMFGKLGDNFAKYFKKGSPVLVSGEWRTNSYTNKDGQKVIGHECLVNHWEFLPREKGNANNNSGSNVDSYVNSVTGIDEEQPFT